MKKRLYFVAARYFRFWAKIQLKRWRPKVFVITGSSGKTTMLHLAEAQLGSKARYSHKANSSFGVPFDILGLSRKELKRTEWLSLISKAPFKAFKGIHKQSIYVVEVDCDRPGEGKFLAELLRPNGVIWLSSTQTHAMNFDKLVKSGKFNNVEQAIAFEYGHILRATSELSILNRDNPDITKQSEPGLGPKENILVSSKNIVSYRPGLESTIFTHEGNFKQLPKEFTIPSLVPEEAGLSALATLILCFNLNFKFDKDFKNFLPPPGRSSVFKGIKNTTLIDGTYNASLDAAEAILNMFASLDVPKKWVVISDVLEQGESEQKVHQQLARDIAKYKFDKIIVMGPRCKKFCSPVLTQLKVEHTAVKTPREVLDILESELTGGETILFKGTRFLEGVIEHLLKDKADAAKLCRREAVWVKRRRAWGL
ncbi:hypothetical protein HYX70_05155 [Candidatus Saccharibacteria bacterium]|nr:hypothetical protein [Candidatus Saccharibacteria bacterium]